MQPSYINDLFVRVAMNIIGLLFKTNRGNRYIYTVVNHFKKHGEAYALAEQKATPLPECFLICSCFGMEYSTCYTPIKALTSNKIC